MFKRKLETADGKLDHSYLVAAATSFWGLCDVPFASCPNVHVRLPVEVNFFFENRFFLGLFGMFEVG